ncbi:hypothetical protein [Rehaibacterium terrae]|uniref:Uncharacterized protein n=1 Tax=Rehaibacterium terrae TaxID=1341696 RepID=A0A7W8DEW4_9GAMM|nr:hypothetical protein [Rehaibacterium terrae]MBB5015992.1 hypothetical protein [Rehaibacterium terrae]
MSVRTTLCLLLCLATVALLAGCAATVVAPGAPVQPRPVYLLDHGRHTSLVLVDASGRPVRIAYGEWRWYVEGETGAVRAFGALFRPTPAALGRHMLRRHDTARFQDEVGSRIRVIVPLQAEAAAVDRLLQDIDRLFEARADTRRYSAALELEFVVHPEPYTLGNNSNHKVAEWLRELGFEVRGSPMLGRWRVREPQAHSDRTGSEIRLPPSAPHGMRHANRTEAPARPPAGMPLPHRTPQSSARPGSTAAARWPIMRTGIVATGRPCAGFPLSSS